MLAIPVACMNNLHKTFIKMIIDKNLMIIDKNSMIIDRNSLKLLVQIVH